MEQLGSLWTVFPYIQYLSIFRKSVEKIQVSLKSDKNNFTLDDDQYTFLIISLSTVLRTRHVLDESCRHEITHFMFKKAFFFNRAVYEIMLKNSLERARPQMTIWRMRISH